MAISVTHRTVFTRTTRAHETPCAVHQAFRLRVTCSGIICRHHGGGFTFSFTNFDDQVWVAPDCSGECEDQVIVGLGVDITEVDRIAAAIARHGRPFLNRVFTAAEIAYCERHRNRFERYAGRFAAKEAAMKALGTGWTRGVRWIDIEVARESSGQPTLTLHGATREHAERLGVRRIAVSITHSGNTAFAQVIFEN